MNDQERMRAVGTGGVGVGGGRMGFFRNFVVKKKERNVSCFVTVTKFQIPCIQSNTMSYQCVSNPVYSKCHCVSNPVCIQFTVLRGHSDFFFRHTINWNDLPPNHYCQYPDQVVCHCVARPLTSLCRVVSMSGAPCTRPSATVPCCQCVCHSVYTKYYCSVNTGPTGISGNARNAWNEGTSRIQWILRKARRTRTSWWNGELWLVPVSRVSDVVVK